MTDYRKEVLKRIWDDFQHKIESTEHGINKEFAIKQEGIVLALQALNIKIEDINDKFKENEFIEKYINKYDGASD